jgi:hypothetical protein
MEVPRERITPLSIALTTVTVALSPTRIITIVAAVVVRGLPVVSCTTTEGPGVVVIAAARSEIGLPAVVIPIAVVGTATVPAILSASVPLVVARVVVARVKIEHADLR